MKTLIILTCFLSLSGMEYTSSWEAILLKINVAVSEKEWEQATELFKLAIKKDEVKAEAFYRSAVGKYPLITPKMAELLAEHHTDNRNYDKALSFCRELVGYEPDNIDYRVKCAETEMLRGNENESMKIYNDILEKQPSNLSANIFMGNYFYIKAEEERMKVENEFKKITSPTKKQYQQYRDDLVNVYNTHYTKAETYLRKVVSLFPSVEAQRTLERMQLLEKEIKK